MKPTRASSQNVDPFTTSLGLHGEFHGPVLAYECCLYPFLARSQIRGATVMLGSLDLFHLLEILFSTLLT